MPSSPARANNAMGGSSRATVLRVGFTRTPKEVTALPCKRFLRSLPAFVLRTTPCLTLGRNDSRSYSNVIKSASPLLPCSFRGWVGANSKFKIQQLKTPTCYHPTVTELKRFLGYIKPYLVQMIAAALMMAIAGALMSLVVATLNPLVNEVLLAKQPEVERSRARRIRRTARSDRQPPPGRPGDDLDPASGRWPRSRCC